VDREISVCKAFGSIPGNHFYTSLSDLIAFAVTSLALGNRCPIRTIFFVVETRKSRATTSPENAADTPKPVNIVVGKILFDYQYQCAGALCRRHQLFHTLFSRRFLLTAFLRRRRISMYVSLFTVHPSGIN
jgi:hypothetical protein